MGSDSNTKDIAKNGRRTEILIIIVAAMIFIAAAILLFIYKSRVSAASMQIVSFEGEASVTENGKPAKIRRNMHLKNRTGLFTGDDGRIKIALDDAKIATLNENGRAEAIKKGTIYELNVSEGRLDFDVTRPLTSDEVLNIFTSTMVVGIRGTEGTVFSKDGREGVGLTEGVVHVAATDPVTGAVYEDDVEADYTFEAIRNDDGTISCRKYLSDEGPGGASEYIYDRSDANFPGDSSQNSTPGNTTDDTEADTTDNTADNTTDNTAPSGENHTEPGYTSAAFVEAAELAGTTPDMIAAMDEELRKFFVADYEADDAELRAYNPHDFVGMEPERIYVLTLKEDQSRFDLSNICSFDIDILSFVWDSPVLPQTQIIFVYDIDTTTKIDYYGNRYRWCAVYRDEGSLFSDECKYDPTHYIVDEHKPLSRFFLDEETICSASYFDNGADGCNYYEGYNYTNGWLERRKFLLRQKRYDIHDIKIGEGAYLERD